MVQKADYTEGLGFAVQSIGLFKQVILVLMLLFNCYVWLYGIKLSNTGDMATFLLRMKFKYCCEK